jgi:hypothetical protein
VTITRTTKRTDAVTVGDRVPDLSIRYVQSDQLFRPDRIEEVLYEGDNDGQRFDYTLTVTGPYIRRNGELHKSARGVRSWSNAHPCDVAEIVALAWGADRLRGWTLAE